MAVGTIKNLERISLDKINALVEDPENFIFLGEAWFKVSMSGEMTYFTPKMGKTNPGMTPERVKTREGFFGEVERMLKRDDNYLVQAYYSGKDTKTKKHLKGKLYKKQS